MIYSDQSPTHTQTEQQNPTGNIPTSQQDSGSLVDSLKEQLRQERFIRQLTQVTSQSFNLSDILKAYSDHVRTFFAADRCVIIRYNTENPDSPMLDVIESFSEAHRSPIGMDAIPKMFAESALKSMVVQPNENEPFEIDSTISRFFQEQRILSQLTAQIIYRGIPYGFVLLCQTTHTREWREEEAATLRETAVQLGVTFYQAELQEKESQHQSRKSLSLASISHELKAPLHNIIAGATMVSDPMLGTLNPKQKEYMALIQTNSTHLLSIINDLLDFSRMEAGHLSLHLEPFPLSELINMAVSLIKPLCEKESQQIVVQYAPNTPAKYNGDRQRLIQALNNLLSNAYKFSPKGTTIYIHCRVQEQYGRPWLVIGVKDQGSGIKPIDITRIFEPFEQVSAEQQSKGTGLGLSIVKKLVELHQGTVEVTSTIGNGSEFNLFLPLP